MGAQQPGNGICGRKLGTIDQRQALLRSKRQRRKMGGGQRIKARYNPSVDKCLAFADHDGRHVSQRRQIAGCPH